MKAVFLLTKISWTVPHWAGDGVSSGSRWVWLDLTASIFWVKEPFIRRTRCVQDKITIIIPLLQQWNAVGYYFWIMKIRGKFHLFIISRYDWDKLSSNTHYRAYIRRTVFEFQRGSLILPSHAEKIKIIMPAMNAIFFNQPGNVYYFTVKIQTHDSHVYAYIHTIPTSTTTAKM